MTEPPVPLVAEEWLRELAVTQPGDSGRGWPLRLLLGAMGTAFGRLHDIVRDTADGLGWTSLLDPLRCPDWALPWLAQFAGVTLTKGLTADQWRFEITSPPSFLRGTRTGMAGAMWASVAGSAEFTANTVKDSYDLTSVSDTSGLGPGVVVIGNGLRPGAQVVRVVGSTVTLDTPASFDTTASGMVTARIVENVDNNAYRLAVITRPAAFDATLEAAVQSQKPLGMVLTTYTSTGPRFMEGGKTFAAVSATFAAASVADVT